MRRRPGRAGVNLDSWAMPPALLDALVAEAASGAEILVIEGVMGLFDGVAGSPGRCGTTADLAARFGAAGRAGAGCGRTIPVGGGRAAGLRHAMTRRCASPA